MGLIERIGVGGGRTERARGPVEKDVNPICYVCTVLIRGLCWEEPFYPLIPSVYFEPHHPSQPRHHCNQRALLALLFLA